MIDQQQAPSPLDAVGAARKAARSLGAVPTPCKDTALLALARLLDERRCALAQANETDVEQARGEGLPAYMVQRLALSDAWIDARMRSLQEIARLPDPVGQTTAAWRCTNDLAATRRRVPLGVILMIYESRPHVTVNAGALCLKAGNAVLLRGGSEVVTTNRALQELWHEALDEAGLPLDAVTVIQCPHEAVGELLGRRGEIDLVIPRGGKGLVRAVSDQARVPVLKHEDGICHVYLDASAELEMAIRIALDSKTLMPEVCNAMETLLVHADLLGAVPQIVEAFQVDGVEVRGCDRVRQQVPGTHAASEEDWSTEYLNLILSIRVVDHLDAAMDHIARYGSAHTDGIVTDSVQAAERFTTGVDSAVVLVNASTMFDDAASLGMGAEIGISTDRLHARGPIGLEQLTIEKYVIKGDGHVMAGT